MDNLKYFEKANLMLLIKILVFASLLALFATYLKELMVLSQMNNPTMQFFRFPILILIVLSLIFFVYSWNQKSKNVFSFSIIWVPIISFVLIAIYEATVQLASVFLYNINLASDWNSVFLRILTVTVLLLSFYLHLVCKYIKVGRL